MATTSEPYRAGERIAFGDRTVTLGAELGRGRYAVVYATTDDEALAVKVVALAPLSEWARAQLSSEAEVHGSCSHPHVLRMHASHVDEGRGAFVALLERARGGELFDAVCRRELFHECDAARVMRQLLSAVDHLHGLGVIHRDLKPENLLLASEAVGADIKIADFGHTKRVGLGGGLAGDDATTPCGSLGYAAPEQLSLRRYEREVDLWACGVIAYVLLSGTMPFDPSKYEDHLAAEPFVVRLPDEHWAGVSADARDFVLRLLQLDPDKRPRAKEALAHPWLQQQGGGGAAVPSPRLPTPTRLQQLQQSGLLHHHFAHAAEVWHFACSAETDGGQWPVAAAPAAAAAASEVPFARDDDVPLLLPPPPPRRPSKDAAGAGASNAERKRPKLEGQG